MSDDLMDRIRAANAFLAGIGWVMMVLEVHGLWRNLGKARRMRYISISCFAFAVMYGSLEAAYWPEHNVRLAWTFLAVVSMIAAGVCGNMEARARRKKRMNGGE